MRLLSLVLGRNEIDASAGKKNSHLVQPNNSLGMDGWDKG